MNYSKSILAAVLIMGAPMNALGSAYKPTSEQLKQGKQIAHDAAAAACAKSKSIQVPKKSPEFKPQSPTHLRRNSAVGMAGLALLAAAYYYYNVTQEPSILAPIVACWEQAFRSSNNLGEAMNLLERCH